MRSSWRSSRIQACSVKKSLLLVESSFLLPSLPNNVFPTRSVVSWPNFYGGAPYKSPRLFYDPCIKRRDKSSSSHERDNEHLLFPSFLSLFFVIFSHSRIPLQLPLVGIRSLLVRESQASAFANLQCSETVARNRTLFRVTLIRISSYILLFLARRQSFGGSPDQKYRRVCYKTANAVQSTFN